jgi:bifunctional non-homologous end joining protein LigD
MTSAVAAYYRAIAHVLVPHLRDRPFTIKRHYTSPRSPFVWEKDAPDEMPAWIRVCPQPAKSRGGALVRYPLVNSRRALDWFVHYGAVDMHVWLSRCDRPDRPDQLLLDLDAKGGSFDDVVAAALRAKDVLDAAGLDSVPHTTGGDGMHVRVPLARVHSFEETRVFAYAVANLVRVPGVTVDAKMNGHGQQVVSVYSTRPPDLIVATPVLWDEVVARLDARAFTPELVVARVQRHGDLAAPLLRGRQRLPV